MALAADTPRLADDPEYAASPLREAAPDDADTLTPDEEMGIAHVFGDRPFTVVADVWGLPVRYRVLNDRDLFECEEAAEQQATSESGRARLLGTYHLTFAVVDVDGNAPLAEDKDDTPGNRFAYFFNRPAPLKAALLDRFYQVQARYLALLTDDHLPKSSGTPAGAGSS